ncbi:MAG: hypothetical protein HZA52_03490 [Planctomycetes bacterium]|nr:hypothetical protein [Planctomycetota bacterium]
MIALLSPPTSSPTPGDVWIVGPGGQFADIQAAIDASSDGDILLVKPGVYASFSVDDKALSIVGDVGGNVIVQGQAQIENLAAKKLLVLARLQVKSQSSASVALRTRYDSGALRIQGCTFEGNDGAAGSGYDGGAAGWIAFDSDIVLVACNLNGGDGASTQLTPGPGAGAGALFARSSNVALHGCALRGGRGGSNGEEGYDGRNGGHALELPEGVTLANGCQLLGGAGGYGGEEDGYPPYFGNYAGDGGDGGHGVFLGSFPPTSANPLFQWRSSVLQGGAAGGGGAGYWGPSGQPGLAGEPLHLANGTPIALAGPARYLSGSSLAREGQSATLDFTGAVGDRVYLRIEHPLSWTMSGGYQLALPTPRNALFLGTIHASGVLTVPLPIPELGAGVEARIWILRPSFVDLQGVEAAGNPFALTLLDQQF